MKTQPNYFGRDMGSAPEPPPSGATLSLHRIEADLDSDMGALLLEEIERYLALHAEFNRLYPE